jgi:short-subunit dehydrogenase
MLQKHIWSKLCFQLPEIKMVQIQGKKKAIIVGASSGIGKESALYLAKKGWDVAICGRRENLLNEVCAENKDSLFPYKLDVSEIDVLPSKLQKIADDLGGLDLLFISAATGFVNTEFDFAKEQTVIRTNVEAFTAMMDWAYGYFKAKGSGQIAAITSISGLLGACEAYSASKAYQINYLTDMRRVAKKEYPNLTVTEIRPGFVDTGIADRKTFWMIRPDEAAKISCEAILKKKHLQYVSPRWRIIGTLLRIYSLWK